MYIKFEEFCMICGILTRSCFYSTVSSFDTNFTVTLFMTKFSVTKNKVCPTTLTSNSSSIFSIVTQRSHITTTRPALHCFIAVFKPAISLLNLCDTHSMVTESSLNLSHNFHLGVTQFLAEFCAVVQV